MTHSNTTVPSRFSVYRRFREDLWGSILSSPKPSSISILSSLLRRHRPIKRPLRLLLPPRKPLRGRRKAPPSFFKRQLLESRKIQLFYSFNRRYRLKMMIRRHNLSLPTGCSIFSVMETCLSTILFRSLLVRSSLVARGVVARGGVAVDGVVCFSPMQRVRPGQLITLLLPPSLPSRYNRIGHRAPPVGVPSYLEVSFSSSTAILLHLPKSEEIFFPFRPSLPNLLASFSRLHPNFSA